MADGGRTSKRPINVLSVSDVKRKCMKLVSEEEVEKTLERHQEKSIDAKIKETRVVGTDLKKQINTVGTIKTSESPKNKIEKLGSAVRALELRTKILKKTLNTSLFSTDTNLIELCGSVTKETLYNMSGVVSIDPVSAGRAMSRFLWDAEKKLETRKTFDFAVANTFNPLLQMDDIDDSYDNEIESEYFDEANINVKQRFAHQAKVLSNFGVIERWSKKNRADIFGEDQLKKVEQRITPGVGEYVQDIEMMLAHVNITKVEKEKKPRERVKKDPNAKKAEQVQMKAKNTANEDPDEVSIMVKLTHVGKCLHTTLKSRKSDSIPLYEFVIDPNDYANTVENMFHVSFLIRNRSAFLLNIDGVPVIKKLKNADEELKAELQHLSQSHGIAHFNYEQWDQLRKTITEKCIT